jgi:hypothetical protein
MCKWVTDLPGFSASAWLLGRSPKPLGYAPENIETPNDKHDTEQTENLPLQRWLGLYQINNATTAVATAHVPCGHRHAKTQKRNTCPGIARRGIRMDAAIQRSPLPAFADGVDRIHGAIRQT